jgi:hypothetical protein
MSHSDSADHPSQSSPKPLGQYLVEAKLLTPAHIEVALYDQRERGYRLGDILAMRGWVKEEIIEWIVQNKLLPERQVEEEDFDTLLLSLKEVLEQKDAEEEPQTAQPWQPDLPPPPPKRTLRATPQIDMSDRDTLVLPDDDD